MSTCGHTTKGRYPFRSKDEYNDVGCWDGYHYGFVEAMSYKDAKTYTGHARNYIISKELKSWADSCMVRMNAPIVGAYHTDGSMDAIFEWMLKNCEPYIIIDACYSLMKSRDRLYKDKHPNSELALPDCIQPWYLEHILMFEKNSEEHKRFLAARNND